MILYEPLPYHIELDGKRYKINPYFDVVLDVLDALDQGWESYVAIDYACSRLIVGKPENKGKAVRSALNLLMKQEHTQQTRKVVDFAQDADLIYSAFYQTYGIDLIEQRGKLHWIKFIALFGGLPSDTRLSDVMRIRSTPIPAPNKHNRKEIENLLRLKTAYALKEKDGGQKGLLRMAEALMKWAGKG